MLSNYGILPAHQIHIYFSKLRPNESVCISQINIGCKCFKLLYIKQMHTNYQGYRLYILKIDGVPLKKNNSKRNVQFRTKPC